MPASKDLKVGAKVRFTQYSHPISNWSLDVDGATGTVVDNDGDYLYVKMDTHFEDLNDWDNCLQWSLVDGDEFPFGNAVIEEE